METAASRGGMAVFLCAEEDRQDLDLHSDTKAVATAPAEVPNKDHADCHRFPLAKAVARRLVADHPGILVRLVQRSTGSV